MKETLAFFMGFWLLAMSGKYIYRGYAWMCRKLSAIAGLNPQGERPVAMLMTGFSLFTGFILLIMGYTAMIVGLPLSIGSVLLGGVMILGFDNIFILVGYFLTRVGERAKLDEQLMLQKERAEISHYKELKEQYDRQRVLIHDMRKHLNAIRDLAAKQGDQAVERYSGEILLEPALQKMARMCGNPILDAVLCRYREICEAKGIAFTADVREGAVDSMSQSGITGLFGNLLENAVEACGRAEGVVEKPFIDLRVQGHRSGGLVTIRLTNTCAQEPKPDRTGGFITQKEDVEQHGLGQKSILSTVRRYSGNMRQFYSKAEKEFHTVIYLK